MPIIGVSDAGAQKLAFTVELIDMLLDVGEDGVELDFVARKPLRLGVGFDVRQGVPVEREDGVKSVESCVREVAGHIDGNVVEVKKLQDLNAGRLQFRVCKNQ